MRQLRVYFLPCLVEPQALVGATAVVIDVLRATTTIVHALAAGADAVVPCLEIDETRRAAEQGARNSSADGADGRILLGGERGGQPIPGFDLGNSPAEYVPEVVGGKRIYLTTTNGTKALLHCRQARRILLAAFVNFSAVCRAIGQDSDVAIVCAGTDQEITREDVLLAGALADEFVRRQPSVRANDQAWLAIDAWRTMRTELTSGKLISPLRDSIGGRNLIEIGQERDIEIAATIDKFDLLPEFDAGSGQIRFAALA